MQKPATTAFLTKLGYLRTFPRAITYALIDWGGLGFRHLGHEVGIQQSLQFLKHLRLNTSIGQILQIHIQHYQLASGFKRSILEDTWPIPWSNAPWMDWLRQFLRHINRKLLLKNPWVSMTRWHNDQHIMSDILEYQLPKNQLIAINSIQLYLKVNVLFELTDHTGTTLLPEKLAPWPTKDGHIYSSPNRSTLDWPTQPKPGPTAWKKWKEVILWMYAKPANMTLTDLLGPWLSTYKKDYERAWQYHEPTQQVYHHHCHVWYEYNNPHQHLNTIIYQHESRPRANLPPDTKPVTPKITNTKITLTTPIYQTYLTGKNPNHHWSAHYTNK